MTKLPSELRKAYESNLLGRLKVKVIQQITDGSFDEPEPYRIRLFIAEKYRGNALYGSLLQAILSLRSFEVIDCESLENSIDLRELINLLEDQPIEDIVFCEVVNSPIQNINTFGLLVSKEDLRDGGFVYQVYLLSEEDFPQQLLGYLEIRANRNAPAPVVSVLEGNQYHCYDFDNYKDKEIALFVFKLLERLHNITKNLKHFNLEELNKLTSIAEPPPDHIASRLLVQAYKDEIKCTLAEIDFNLVKPHSLDFCLTFPMELITLHERGLSAATTKYPLLVYWNDTSFIMSDDYPIYLAYRKMSFTKVAIVILGEYPIDKVRVIKEGRHGLIPPAGLIKWPDDDVSLTDEMKEWKLERILNYEPISKELSKLYAVYFVLSSLVQSPNVTEREIHEFLFENPLAIDPVGAKVFSQVRLGKKFVIDLVIQYVMSHKKILLIELENATHKLFTKSKRLRSEVTHSCQQVDDWLQWWMENPSSRPNFLDGSIYPEGLVVMGRSSALSNEERETLIHLNQNRRTKIITYDDLLEQILTVIKHIEGR